MPKASPRTETRDPIAEAAALAAGQVQIGAEPQVIELGPDQVDPENEPEQDETKELIGGKFKSVDDLLAEYEKVDSERRASTREFQRFKPLIDKAQKMEPFLEMASTDAKFREHVLKYSGFSGEPEGEDLPEDLGSMSTADLLKIVDRRAELRAAAIIEDERKAQREASRNQAQFDRLREAGLSDSQIDALLEDLQNNPASLVDVHRSRNLDKIVRDAVDTATKGLVGTMGQRRAPSPGAAGGQADEPDGILDFLSKFKNGIKTASD